MPNRFGRAVPVGDYNPRPLLPDGLLPVSRPDGSAEEQRAAALGRIAKVAGDYADEAAIAEGKAAGAIDGQRLDWRPSGSMTLRAQAHDKAALASYQDTLDASIRNDLQGVYEANKKDPAKLTAALDTLHAEYQAKHVMPSQRAAFDAAFTRLRVPYQNKALADIEADQKDRALAGMLTNLTASQTNAARIAALDPAGAATADVVRGEIRRIDGLIDAGVASDAISAANAAKLKTKHRDDVLTNAAIAQAGALKTDAEIAAYRDNARQRFGQGKFDGLSADGWQTLDAGLAQLQAQKRTQANAGVAKLDKDVGDYVDRAASGLSLSGDEWTRFAASEAARTPQGAAVLAAGEQKVKIATVMSKMSVDDASRFVAGMRAEANKGGASAPEAAILTFAEDQLKKQRTELNTDQLGFAEAKRLVPQIAPLDFQGFAAAADDPAAAGVLASQFRDRTAQARAIAADLSRAPQFLRPEEKDRLKEIVDRGGAPALALAGAIVKGSGTDAQSILREISGDAPLLAQAGLIVANGGSLSAARDAFHAARVKAETGQELPPVAAATAGKALRDTLGTAFLMQGEDGSRVRLTADQIARTRLAAGAVDPKSGDAETIYKRALQEAAGARFLGGVQYGGVADYKPPSWWWGSVKLPVPPGIKADAIRDVVRGIRDDELQALPVPPRAADGAPFRARDISLAVPVAVRGGYRFALGDPQSSDPKYIRGADGAPFVLPFSALEDSARRVGALLGGG